METVMTPLLTTFEDSVLIEMALDGRADCFAILMERHLASVKRCIVSMVRDRADVDDLVQEVLLKVWRHLSTFRLEASFRTWMTRVAVNEVLQLYRRQKHSRVCQAFGDLDAFASSSESPYHSTVRAETAKTLRGAVARLPSSYRQALILRDMEQLTTSETAVSLRTTVPAVKTRLFRARYLLAASLKDHFRPNRTGSLTAG
jgi:RNA polymerase sigma-70 factor (ECF subfamily)